MNPNRRQLLKGASLGAGGLLLSPVLQQIQAQASGTDLRNKRFVFVVEGNGLPWQQIQPVGIERTRIPGNSATSRRTELVNRSLTGNELPPALQPIAQYKDHLTVIQGLSGKMCSGGHSNDFGALGAYNPRGGVGRSGTPVDETIDYSLGRRLRGVFPQIGLGISDRPEHTMVYNCSASGPAQALPTQCRPDLAYYALFGGAAEGNARRAFDSRRNLLDHMVRDIRRVENSFGGPERENMQEYLRAFESMQQRHGRLVEMEETLRRNAPRITNKFTSDVETDRLDAQFDIASSALISGLTSVVTLASGVGNRYFSVKFTGLGITIGKHSIGHGANFNGRDAFELSTQIRRFHFELIARLIQRLQSVREGNGTMFDNTLIVYLSDAAEGHHSRCWEWPFVLIGNLGGRLNSGRYIEYPGHGANGNKTIGNLYTTFLHAIGADDVNLFGRPDPLVGRDVDQNGPLSELLA